MDDLIRRQDAIDKFKLWLEVKGYSEGERNIIKAVLYELENMPSAQQEKVCIANITLSEEQLREAVEKSKNEIIQVLPSAHQWIPCSERMPKVSDHYLIQHSRHICPDEMAVAYYSVEEAKVDENYTWEFIPFADCKEVIAWMPLPKPYKEVEENA